MTSAIQKIQENALPAASCHYYKIEIIMERGKKARLCTFTKVYVHVIIENVPESSSTVKPFHIMNFVMPSHFLWTLKI